jgi:hypothetical protein
MGLQLREESWIWYALAVFLVVCRVLSRTILLGNVTRLKVDDWLMVVTLAPYTVLLVVINIVAHTSSNLLGPGTNVETMSQSDKDERIYGSKLVLTVEQMQLMTIWLVKACLLILYYRLTYVQRMMNTWILKRRLMTHAERTYQPTNTSKCLPYMSV